MMTVFAIIFPLALLMAVGTIVLMLMAYGGKMMAALRMEPYGAPSASSQPSAVERANGPRASSRLATHDPILLAA